MIAGDFQGAKGPAQTFTPIAVWDAKLRTGHRTTWHFTAGDTALIVVQRGKITVNDSTDVSAVELVHFDRAGAEIAITATDDATVLFLSGTPIGEPVVGQGPFVMNTTAEIRQAIVDFQSGRMGRIGAR